jgi:hypothetical protein
MIETPSDSMPAQTGSIVVRGQEIAAFSPPATAMLTTEGAAALAAAEEAELAS